MCIQNFGVNIRLNLFETGFLPAVKEESYTKIFGTN